MKKYTTDNYAEKGKPIFMHKFLGNCLMHGYHFSRADQRSSKLDFINLCADAKMQTLSFHGLTGVAQYQQLLRVALI